MKAYHSKEFSIYAGNDVFHALFEYLIEKGYSKVLVLVDENTEKYCLPFLSQFLLEHKIIRIFSGEENKNISSCEIIWREFDSAGADRKSVLINLGGGVVTDMGGFCASVYKRGINFINVPTTLMGMVDAAIGGKTAVNLDNTKNSIGLFQHPKGIYVYPPFLKTLSERQSISGFAEIIKHSLISDKEFFRKLENLTVLPADEKLLGIIQKSLKIKRKIVVKDPFEKSLRKILNFGHTIGHAVESVFLNEGKNHLFHGEAIAVGMVSEAYISQQLNYISKKELKDISDLIKRFYPKIDLNGIDFKDLYTYMQKDKKNIHGKVNFTLLKKIGKGIIDQEVSASLIEQSLNFYSGIHDSRKS